MYATSDFGFAKSFQITALGAVDTFQICLRQAIKDTFKVYNFCHSVVTSKEFRQTIKMVYNFGVLVYSIVQILVDAEVKRCTKIDVQSIAPIEAKEEEVVKGELMDDVDPVLVGFKPVALLTAKIDKVEEVVSEVVKPTITQLRKIAKERKIPRYSRLTYDQLLVALS